MGTWGHGDMGIWGHGNKYFLAFANFLMSSTLSLKNSIFAARAAGFLALTFPRTLMASSRAPAAFS